MRKPARRPQDFESAKRLSVLFILCRGQLYLEVIDALTRESDTVGKINQSADLRNVC